MFTRLKNFSEDVAKSFNELNYDGLQADKGEDDMKKRLERLSNGSKVLNIKTPDTNELTQPKDQEGSEASNSDVNDGPGITLTVGSRPNTESEDVDITQLPPIIRARMRKFAKYEEKYPILFEAYKTEKRKNFLVHEFEKILRENTPILSISEAQSLLEYLNGLSEKTKLLTSEIRTHSKDNESLKKRIESLEAENLSLKNSDSKTSESNPILESSVQDQETHSDLKYRGVNPEEDNLRKSEVMENDSSEASKDDNCMSVAPLLVDNLDRSHDKSLEAYKVKIQELKKEIEDKNKELQKMSEQNKKLSVSIKEIENQSSDIQDETDVSADEKKTKLETDTRRSEISLHNKDNDKMSQFDSGLTKPHSQNLVELSEDNQEELLQLKEKYRELKFDYDTLLAKYKERNEEFKSKSEEVENLRETVKEIGNDLVTSREEIKTLSLPQDTHSETAKFSRQTSDIESTKISNKGTVSSNSNENENINLKAEIKHLKEVLSSLPNQLANEDGQQSMEQRDKLELSELRNNNSRLEREIEGTKSKIENKEKIIRSLNEKTDSLEIRIKELSLIKSKESSLKLEIVSLKSTMEHKDQQIDALKTQIENMEKENVELLDRLAKIDTSHKKSEVANKSLMIEKNDLLTKQESLLREISDLQIELKNEIGVKENAIKDLGSAQSKYENALREATASGENSQFIQQQYEELKMRTKESSTKIEFLEDRNKELDMRLQEKSREASSIKRVLLETEEKLKVQSLDLRNQILALNEEKDDLQSTQSLLMKKKQHEIDDLRAKLDALTKNIKGLELKLRTFQEENERLQKLPSDSNDSNENYVKAQDIIEELRSNLFSSTNRVQEYEKMNNMLKRLNDEANLKCERLSKNYKQLMQLYQHLQAINSAKDISSSTEISRKSSITSLPDEIEKKETNVAYLKNVLLGFFEHKDRREQLLPVIKTLFDFSSEDEKKLLFALK